MFKKIARYALIGSMMPMMANAQTMSIEDRLAELEANQSLNIFKFSGTLETWYDSIKAKQTTATAYEGNVDYMRLRASLNVDADVSKSIKFYSRFTTSKFFNKYFSQATTAGAGVVSAPSVNPEFAESRDERGSQVYLEKAYADVTVGDSGLIFSFGRLPTMDGPFVHYPTGKARSGTYPALMYNASLDGLAGSYNMKSDAGDFSARLIYTPTTYFATSAGTTNPVPSYQTSPTVGGAKTNTTNTLTSLMLEYSKKMEGIGALNLIYQGYQTGEIEIPGSAFNNGTGTSGSVSSKVSANSLTASLDDIASLGLDFGLTYLTSEVKNQGTITIGPSSIFGIGASTLGETLTGSSVLASLRYRIASLYLGAEYLAGGKNVFIYDVGADNLTSFYSTPGTGTHAYLLYKFHPELGLRLGYMNQEYKNTPFTFGPSRDTDRKISTYYANLRLDF